MNFHYGIIGLVVGLIAVGIAIFQGDLFTEPEPVVEEKTSIKELAVEAGKKLIREKLLNEDEEEPESPKEKKTVMGVEIDEPAQWRATDLHGTWVCGDDPGNRFVGEEGSHSNLRRRGGFGTGRGCLAVRLDRGRDRDCNYCARKYRSLTGSGTHFVSGAGGLPSSRKSIACPSHSAAGSL